MMMRTAVRSYPIRSFLTAVFTNLGECYFRYGVSISRTEASPLGSSTPIKESGGLGAELDNGSIAILYHGGIFVSSSALQGVRENANYGKTQL